MNTRTTGWRQRLAAADQAQDVAETEFLRLTATGVHPATAAVLARQPGARSAGARMMRLAA